MKLRICFRWHVAIPGNQIRVIEIDRKINNIAGRIDINNLDVFANRTRLKRLPRNFKDN